MQAQNYWNEVGVMKYFEDPLYIDKLAPYLTEQSRIVEYGCGYGRMLNALYEDGYKDLLGFDFAPGMIERGRREHPHLDLRAVGSSIEIPIDDQSADAVVLSTVLCCLTEPSDRYDLLSEVHRVLSPTGVLYLTDFLVCKHPSYIEKYAEGERRFGRQGMYITSENLVVCHYTSSEVLNLLSAFDVQWFEQFDFKTMNQNPARTFHCIAQK